MEKRLYVNRWIRVRESGIDVYPKSLEIPELQGPEVSARDIYDGLSLRYPKFFKMDRPSQWAWLASEWLLTLPPSSWNASISRDKVALVFATESGSLEVDQRFHQSMESVPSPALFVYTLANIMLGEICIRHGFKGEQLCLVDDLPPFTLIRQYVEDLLWNRDMEACLLGWVEAFGEQKKIALLWVSHQPSTKVFEDESIREWVVF